MAKATVYFYVSVLEDNLRESGSLNSFIVILWTRRPQYQINGEWGHLFRCSLNPNTRIRFLFSNLYKAHGWNIWFILRVSTSFRKNVCRFGNEKKLYRLCQEKSNGVVFHILKSSIPNIIIINIRVYEQHPRLHIISQNLFTATSTYHLDEIAIIRWFT